MRKLIVYHGTNVLFHQFDQNKARNPFSDYYGGGIAYFTDNKDIAKSYARSNAKKFGGKPYVYEVEISIDKIFDVDSEYTGTELTKFFNAKTLKDFAIGTKLARLGGEDLYVVMGKLEDGKYKLNGDIIFKALSNGMNATTRARETLKKLHYNCLRYNGGIQSQGMHHNVYCMYNAHDIKIKKIVELVKQIKEEVITEVFNQPYKWIYSFGEYIFKTDKNIKYHVQFINQGQEGYELYFFQHNNDSAGFEKSYQHIKMDITGSGDAFKVFSTIIDIVKDFFAKNKISYIQFSSQERSRSKLYHQILKKLAPKSWQIDTLSGSGGVDFTISINEMTIPPSALNISREHMPQITSNWIDHFLTELSLDGIAFKEEKLISKILKPTQSEFNMSKVKRMKHVSGDKPIIVSRDFYILDGHHRWLAVYNQDKNRKINCIMIDLPILDLINRARNFKNASFRSVNETIKHIVKDKFKDKIYG